MDVQVDCRSTVSGFDSLHPRQTQGGLSWDVKKGNAGLKLVGKTRDGRLVVQGVFAFFETYGLPLDIILDRLRSNNIVPDWAHMYDSMVGAGWHPERTLRRLQQIVGDVYGPWFRKEWEIYMIAHAKKV